MGRNPAAPQPTRYYLQVGSMFQFRLDPHKGWAVCYTWNGLAKAKAMNWVEYGGPRPDFEEFVKNGNFIEYIPEDLDGT